MLRKTSQAIIAISLSCAMAVPAIAQDTPGQPTENPGTVVKGKAPVAKELLKVRFPKPKSFKLKNGLTVYLLEDHRLPAVRLSLQMRAGSFFEPKPGVASMTASMLTEGTANRGYLQIAEVTENIGASLNAMSSMENATVGVAGLTQDLDTLLGLLSEVLLKPSFPADRLDRIKLQRRQMSSQGRSSPTGMTGQMMSKVLYAGTPYGRRSPKPEDLAAITRDDLVAYYQAYYRPNGAILAVTGGVRAKELRQKLEAALGDWKPSDKTPEVPKVPVPAKETTMVYIVDRPGSAQTVLQFGNVAIPRTDPDYAALTVANQILGGGSSGRLFQNIRERKGYTYGAYSTFSAGLWPGTWGASASVRTDVTEPAAHEFFYEFERIQKEPVTADELARAKRSIVGSFARTLESTDGVLGRYLEIVQYGLPKNYWDTFPARIEAVTADDVMRVARKYLGVGRIQLFAVGERKKIEAGLKQYGSVEIVDPKSLGGSEFGGPRGG